MEFAKKWKLQQTKNTSRQIYKKSKLCPVLSTRIQRNDSVDIKYPDQCKPWKQTESVCRTATNFYSINKDIYCRKKHRTGSNICSFSGRTSQISCDRQICRNGSLFVGTVNPETGVVMSQDWNAFRSARSIELAMPGIISKNLKYGLTFCLIRCVKNDEIIDQLLTFPHHLKKHEKLVRKTRTNRNVFNINIVVFDSVSRNHFYRMLNKTVKTIRQMQHSSDVLVLDYEFLQSLAPHTYTNVKALFSGKIEEGESNPNISINTLYDHFKRHGYHTLFQEDTCWYDHWGSVLENNIRKEKKPQSIEEFKKSWEHFRNLTMTYSIDDYGLTHFTCVVLAMHGISNMFNEPLKICYDGQPISSHFLRYTQDFLGTKDEIPRFSYLHTNFGHEKTGFRIKALDDVFSDSVSVTANQKGSLTLVLSDHGPKTTVYSQDYLHGRYETYDSCLFMIIPKKVQDELGEARISKLVKNQRSLITMQDVHKTLIEMTQLHKRHRNNGLFSDISNRTCDSTKMVNYGICKCRDWERIFIDQSPQFLWLAEYATEFLNNEIRRQFSKSNRLGFGNCRKLLLHRIWNIRQRISNGSYLTTFDLIVQPFYTDFIVQTKHTENNGVVYNVSLQSWRRVSIYRRYVKCKDKTVDAELCVCYLTRQNSNKRLLRMIQHANVSEDKEVIRTKTLCLYIILTKAADKQETIFSYDVINTCAKHYIFTVDRLENVNKLQSGKIIKELQPNTETFLFSVVVERQRKPMFKYYFKQNSY